MSDFSRFLSLFGEYRKFSINEKPKTEDFTKNYVSNSDSIIGSLAGLSIVSSLLKSSTEEARKSLTTLFDLMNESISEKDDTNKRGNKGKLLSESDLNSVQNMFIDKVLSTQNVDQLTDEDLKIFFRNAANELVKRSTLKSSISSKPKLSPQTNKATPEIDYVEKGTRVGITDKFYARLVFSLKQSEVQENNIKAIRIFRSTKKIPESIRNTRIDLSQFGVYELMSNTMRTRIKNYGKENLEIIRTLNESGVDNAYEKSISLDNINNTRVALTQDDYNNIKKDLQATTKSSDDKNLQFLSSFFDVQRMSALDASVVDDLKTIRNIQLRNPDLKNVVDLQTIYGGNYIDRDVISRLNKQQIENLRKNLILDSDIVINTIFSSFKELAIIPISRLKSKKIGNDIIEFYYYDNAVQTGNTYSYYVTTLDDEITESVRSKIIKVNIEDDVPPSPPRAVTIKEQDRLVSISLKAPTNEKIEKFEIYRKDFNSIKQKPVNKVKLIGENGYAVTEVDSKEISNGFVFLGECLNSKFGGSVFYDKTALPGKKYIYRLYSVDIFGNKSQNAKEVIYYLNNKSGKIEDIQKPTVVVEKVKNTPFISLSISSNDNRIVGFFVDRKNTTLKQRGFSIPTQPNDLKISLTDAKNNASSVNETYKSKDNAWTGFIRYTGEEIEFIDKTTRYDMTYQYRVWAIDKFGHKSSYEVTRNFFVSRRPIVDSPLNLRAEKDGDNITITWDTNVIDKSPLDRLGNRTTLEENSVKTLFQLERKKSDEEIWRQFPLVEDNSIIDKISSEENEVFRPPFLEADSTYFYRVSSFQSGGFISNFTSPITVNTFNEILQPANFKIKVCDTKCKPFFVALNWDTEKDSGTVDRWIVERAGMNNFAAAGLNVTTTEDIKDLDFIKIAEVNKESSRALSIARDNKDAIKNLKLKKLNVLSGEHIFIDKDVYIGNTYFYRLTAVGINSNNTSPLAYRGIRLEDYSFSRKVNSILTQEERDNLVESKEILMLKGLKIR